MTNNIPKKGDRVFVRFASGMFSGKFLFGTYVEGTGDENYPHLVILDIHKGATYENPSILSVMDEIGPIA